ncbi:lysostaphin resistance A-like protein [candidate division KSB1 bacterium]
MKTKSKIWSNPLIRILIVIAFLVPATILNLIVELTVKIPGELPGRIFEYSKTLFMIYLFARLYRLYVSKIEKREAFEFSRENMHKELSLGLLIGTALLSVVVLFTVFTGYYKVESSIFDIRMILDGVFEYGIAVFLEEVLYRLIIFRLTEEFLGSRIALLIQLILFGLGHSVNPNATAWTPFVMIGYGILLTAAYMYTRRIWLVFGLHFSWNFIQGTLLGISVSGKEVSRSMIQLVPNGPDIFTGGAFGIEGSIITIITGTMSGLFLLWKVYKSKSGFVPMKRKT